MSVVVATYGPGWWTEIAQRAIASALPQAPVIVKHEPDGALATARNNGLAEVETEFVVFLDADDELEPGYIDAVAGGSADLRAPILHQFRHGQEFAEPFYPKVPEHEHECDAECLRRGNWMVIGTAARARLVREAGGFDERWPVYEDYALWQRMWLAGATVERIPAAVYRAHLGVARSRNRSLPIRQRNLVHEAIDKANGCERPDGYY